MYSFLINYFLGAVLVLNPGKRALPRVVPEAESGKESTLSSTNSLLELLAVESFYGYKWG